MNLPPGLRLSLENNPAWEDRDFVDESLGRYNEQFLEDTRWSYFGVFARAADRTIRAGLIGNCYAGWLHINLLWVAADLRRQGVGSGLMSEAERHGRQFGCHSAWVETFTFQGPDFYPRLGYQEFARMDVPPGHARISFWKRLT